MREIGYWERKARALGVKYFALNGGLRAETRDYVVKAGGIEEAAKKLVEEKRWADNFYAGVRIARLLRGPGHPLRTWDSAPQRLTGADRFSPRLGDLGPYRPFA